jgi:hypothetical protein
MGVGWNIYFEAHPVGGDPTSTTEPYPDEEAAREAFGAMRHDVKYGETRTRWLIQLRHGAEVVDEFKSPV